MKASNLVNVPTPFTFQSVLGVCKNIDRVEVLNPVGIGRPDVANILIYSKNVMVGAFYPTTEVTILGV